MVKPPIPKNEAQRIALLRDLKLLDTGPEERIDRITRVAERVFAAASVTLSIVGEDRVFFKSLQGRKFSAPSREASFTAHALVSENLLLVRDTREDKRFADNPLVVEPPHFRFYAGQPLRAADGSILGALCLWDLKPRDLSPSERLVLWDLAAMAEEQLASNLLTLAQISLHEARGDLEAFLETAADLVQVVDSTGRFLFRNKKWHESLGYTPQEAALLGLFDVLQPAHHAQWKALLGRALAGDPPVNVEASFAAKDGSTVEVSGKLGGQRQGGKVVAVRAVLRELTRSRAAERRLRQLTHIVRGLDAATTPEEAAFLVLRETCEACGWEAACLWTAAEGGCALRVAAFYRKAALGAGGFEAALRRDELSPDAGLAGRVWTSRKPSWSGDLLRERDFPAAAHAEVEGLQAAVALPVGSGGQAYGVVCFFNAAIAEPDPALWETLRAATVELARALRLHRAESGRERADLSYAALTRSCAEAYFVVDADGRITDCNEAAARLYGRSRQESLGRTAESLWAADGAAHWQGLWAGLRRGEGGSLAESRHQRADGSPLTVSCAAAPLRDSVGRFAGAVLLAADLGPLRAAEAEAARLRAAVADFARVRWEVLGCVARDFHPALQAAAQGLERLRGAGLPAAEQRAWAAEAGAAVAGPARAVARFAEYARLAAEEPDLEPVDFDLSRLVETALRGAAPPESGPELLAAVADELSGLLYGEQRLLGQALQSLIENAVKSAGKGQVSVRASLAEQREGRLRVRLEVGDTGPGVSAQDRDWIWGGWAPARDEAARRRQGLGLGLPLAKRCVELMGGSIGLGDCAGPGACGSGSSAGPGRTDFPTAGACFWIEVWLDRRAAAPAQPPLPKAAGEARFLVTDDNEACRGLLLERLSSWGLKAAAARSAAEALALVPVALKEARLCVALIDQGLPEADGPVLIGRLLADRSVSSGLRTILMTLPGQAPDLRALAASGADLFLEKPVGPAALRQALALILEAGMPSRAAAPAAPPPRPFRVLLVEDEEMHRRWSLLALRRLGYEADLAADGREGADRAAGRPYGLILMDLRLPVVDGLQAAAELRRRQGPLRRTPVIGLAEAGDAGARQRCLAAGLDGCIVKPLRQEDLAQVLDDWDSPLDHAVLKHFFEVAGADQLGVVAAAMDQFLADASAALAKAQDAAVHKDADGLLAAVRQSPETAANLGAKRFVETAAALARAAPEGDWDAIERLRASWEDEFEKVKAALERKRPAGPRV